MTMVGLEDAAGAITQWPAEIVGTDAAHDLAVLQIAAPAQLLVPIKVGLTAGRRVVRAWLKAASAHERFLPS